MAKDGLTPYYERDGITIYHGDCRDILPHLPKVDLVLTDPPYNVGRKYLGRSDRRADYKEWCADWFSKLSEPKVFSVGVKNLAMWYEIQPPD